MTLRNVLYQKVNTLYQKVNLLYQKVYTFSQFRIIVD